MKKQMPGTNVRIIGRRNIMLSSINLFSVVVFTFCLLSSYNAQAASNQPSSTNPGSTRADLSFDDFLKTIGKPYIRFDASNIKQFWVDHSVVGYDDNFEICLNNEGESFTSEQFPFQVANVNEALDCKIYVFAETSDFSFTVLNSRSSLLSNSSPEKYFPQNNVASSVIHLESIPDFSFNLRFSSNKSEAITIKGIALTFEQNMQSSYLPSPGSFNLSMDNISGSFNKDSISSTPNSITFSGTKLRFTSKKKILVTNNTVSHSLKLKNNGSKPLKYYVGYTPYTKEKKEINSTNTLYGNNNTILKVVKSEENSNKIIVDAISDWKKGCTLALDAKEDLSDFPNINLVKEKILEVNKISENETEIVFDKPLSSRIETGTSVRIQSPQGDATLYTNRGVLNPDEAVEITYSISKDEDCYNFTPNSFCKNTYSVVPVLNVSPATSGDEITVTISDYTVSY